MATTIVSCTGFLGWWKDKEIFVPLLQNKPNHFNRSTWTSTCDKASSSPCWCMQTDQAWKYNVHQHPQSNSPPGSDLPILTHLPSQFNAPLFHLFPPHLYVGHIWSSRQPTGQGFAQEGYSLPASALALNAVTKCIWCFQDSTCQWNIWSTGPGFAKDWALIPLKWIGALRIGRRTGH